MGLELDFQREERLHSSEQAEAFWEDGGEGLNFSAPSSFLVFQCCPLYFLKSFSSLPAS